MEFMADLIDIIGGVHCTVHIAAIHKKNKKIK